MIIFIDRYYQLVEHVGLNMTHILLFLVELQSKTISIIKNRDQLFQMLQII